MGGKIWVIASVLSLVGVVADAVTQGVSHPREVRERLRKMTIQGEGIIAQAKEGLFDVAVEQAEEMIQEGEKAIAHVREGLKRQKTQGHGEGVIKHIQEAIRAVRESIEHAESGHDRETIDGARKALEHIKEADRHARKME